jgi:hypothetical protein
MSRRREELEEKRKADAEKEREEKERFEKQNRVSQLIFSNAPLDEEYCISCIEGQDKGRY